MCHKRPQSQFERGLEWCGWSLGSLGRVRLSGLYQELLEMRELLRSSVRHGEAMFVEYSVFRGNGRTLILINHTNVFAPRIWPDGLFGWWSRGSLIPGSLLADT